MSKDERRQGDSWLDRLDKTMAENSKMALFLLLQLFVIFLLVIGYMKMINKLEVRVELPTTIKESGTIIVGKDFANEIYYKMWGREDIEKISTFNQKTIKDKILYLKQRMYPPYYYKNVRLFRKYEKEIATNLVSQKFTFSKNDIVVKMSGKSAATVSVKGFYSKSLDDEKVVNAKECMYQLGYLMKGGHIYVQSFKTNCK